MASKPIFLQDRLKAQIKADMEEATTEKEERTYLFMLSMQENQELILSELRSLADTVSRNPALRLGVFVRSNPKLSIFLATAIFLGGIVVLSAAYGEQIKALFV